MGPARPGARRASLGLPPEATDDDAALYYHDLPDEVAEEALRRTWQDQSMTPMEQRWPLPAWPDVPTRVVAGRHDRLFPLAFQRRVTRERLGLEPDEIDRGRMLALANPRGLADRLEAYRRAYWRRPGSARLPGAVHELHASRPGGAAP